MERRGPYFAGFHSGVTVANRLRLSFKDWLAASAGDPQPAIGLTSASDELQHDLAAMRARAMLDQIDRLPRAQGEFATKHRHI